METQTRLSRHNKFISAENIVGIFSVSSDDSFTCSVTELFVICLKQFLNELELICLPTVQCLQVLLFIVCTQLNGFKHYYLMLIIQY